ncbi:hypothetical protein Bresa_03574|uniref:Uncharacterized protein n=1 Tax=Brenneria salicis ATCC 15712 = DSM 30166 TaxID=714314 RepID=A0A366IA75_9GAMM|nr:hypothetical protein [Brenneria salicis ATCC 15712 = DSM 30166]RBP65259.1 hypothetical protein DES54_105137 [Brenneria salicis ATCC 15712 = DSM 30166]
MHQNKGKVVTLPCFGALKVTVWEQLIHSGLCKAVPQPKYQRRLANEKLMHKMTLVILLQLYL